MARKQVLYNMIFKQRKNQIEYYPAFMTVCHQGRAIHPYDSVAALP